MWASVGWGALSTFAGMLITRYGIQAGFLGYAVLAVPCVAVALSMEFNPIRARLAAAVRSAAPRLCV
jgi:hypothetical protein